MRNILGLGKRTVGGLVIDGRHNARSTAACAASDSVHAIFGEGLKKCSGCREKRHDELAMIHMGVTHVGGRNGKYFGR